jgi:ketosteroid isomerase-like protein
LISTGSRPGVFLPVPASPVSKAVSIRHRLDRCGRAGCRGHLQRWRPRRPHELYESDAALIAEPGSVAHGSEQVRAALQGFMALKRRITLDTKLVFTVGDLAHLSNTWSLSGTGPDGNPVSLGATTAEVARRQVDGSWRYVIDNAWGDQAVAG